MQLLAELLVCTLNSILFQRGLYQRHLFKRVQQWGAPIMVCTHPEVKAYLKDVISRIRQTWLKDVTASHLAEISLLITDADNAVIERWQFVFQCREGGECSLEVVNARLRALMRQIHSTVTFLPVLRGVHSFRIAITDEALVVQGVPEGWTESTFKPVMGSSTTGEFDEVQLDEQLLVLPSVVYKQSLN